MKRHVKRSLDLIHSISFWQLCITIVILLPLGLFGLRQNNLQMGELKLAVIEADQRGEGIQESLQALSRHVFNHMNTSTEIELASSFDREVARIQAKASENLVDPQLFSKGQAACASRPASARLQCVQDYVVSNSNASADVVNLDYPEKGLYRHSFAAPLWSPDLAGWSLLGVAVSLLLLCFKLIHKKTHSV